jgi:hypothetical protein
MAAPAQDIARLGFRRWYERQLIESHLWLVTGVLSGILIVALIEDFSPRAGAFPLLSLLLILAAAPLAAWALRRYIHLLQRAEWLAEQCTCPACAAYGAVRVVEAALPPAGDDGLPAMRVACRKCGHCWPVGT